MSLDSADYFVLNSALQDVVRWSPLLDDLMVPRQASSGENSGKPPARGKSKMPLVVHPLDVKRDLEIVIFAWCGSLVDVLGVAPTVPRVLSSRAAWLLEHCDAVAAREWSHDFLEELIEVVRPMRDLVQVEAGNGQDQVERRYGTIGTVAVVDQAVAVLADQGLMISKRTIDRWIADGRVAAVQDSAGRVLINPLEILRILAVK